MFCDSDLFLLPVALLMNIAVAIVCLSRCNALSLMFGTEDCTVKSTDDFVLLSRFQASKRSCK